MNSSKMILALWLSVTPLGAAAWGQVTLQKPPQNPPVAAQPKAAPASPAASSPKPKAAPVSPAASSNPAPAPKTPVNAQPAKLPAKPGHVASKRHAKHVAHYSHYSSTKHVARTVSTPASDGRPHAKTQRDPFVSPVVGPRIAAACSGTGKQCLEIGEISLHGVVHAPNGYIAVVVNGDHTYFLRENDPLADGSVTRITRDSIILRERYVNDAGRTVEREVTRKIGHPAV